MTFTCNWGILATGGIAKTFSKDLLVDPSTRGVSDVRHRIVAIASSSGTDKAKQFAQDIGLEKDEVDSVAYYGNYEDFVKDKNIDIVYVATPHSRHYQCCRLALEAGKNVLCEKPFTINAKQLQVLIDLAKEKNLFLMEAVWTRFFPLVKKLQRMLFEDRVIGDLLRVSSDLSIPFNDVDVTHRLKNPDLGGGALLDLGIYALTWLFITAYADPQNKRKAPTCKAAMLLSRDTGVDEFTTLALTFPQSHVSAVAVTSYSAKNDVDVACRIEGQDGYIVVADPLYRPTKFTVVKYVDGISGSETSSTVYEEDIPGHGMFYEADECARCLSRGEKQSTTMTLEESLVVSQVMDKARADNDFVYPEELESL